ncbi:MAG TPA: APC family permease [Actinomycetota bacterium]|nr:APC family permease [Actinomycetota bacterium]
MGTRASERPAEQGLRANTLRLLHLTFVGLAYFSLAPVIYFNMGLMESEAGGPVMPLLFIVITLAVLPTAVSFAIMNNRRPSAGSAYTWLWESTYPAIGLWLGWVLTTTYFLVVSIYPPIFGLFFNSLLDSVGITPGFATGLLGGFLLIVVVAILTHNDIRVGSNVIGVLMIFEAGFIVIQGGELGRFTAAPFDPGAAANGLAGIATASIFAFLSIAGVDSIAPLAEESNTPKRLVPFATIFITLLAGLYWTLTSYGFAISVPVSEVERFVEAGQVTPVLPIAERYIGAWNILVPITALTAVAASFGASIFAASRLLYALARDGFAPRPFARLHHKYQTPWNAELAVLVVSAVLLVVVTVWQEREVASSGAWLAQAFVFFVLIPYIFVNIANIVYHARHRRADFNWFTNGLLPVLGIAICGFILWYAFFNTLLGGDFKTQASIVWFALAWAALGVIWVITQALRRDLRGISLHAEV